MLNTSDGAPDVAVQDQQELIMYRNKVRDRAIRGYHDDWFTAESLDATLRELDLEPYGRYVQDFRFTLQLDLSTEATEGEIAATISQLDYDETLAAITDAVRGVLAARGAGNLVNDITQARYRTGEPVGRLKI